MAETGVSLEDTEECDGCDVAIHGRGGVDCWMVGSVTERLLGATRRPLLIV
jgi:hypothetical protein